MTGWGPMGLVDSLIVERRHQRRRARSASGVGRSSAERSRPTLRR
jgi:hypothetical protein